MSNFIDSKTIVWRNIYCRIPRNKLRKTLLFGHYFWKASNYASLLRLIFLKKTDEWDSNLRSLDWNKIIKQIFSIIEFNSNFTYIYFILLSSSKYFWTQIFQRTPWLFWQIEFTRKHFIISTSKHVWNIAYFFIFAKFFLIACLILTSLPNYGNIIFIENKKTDFDYRFHR